eukprot:9394631-Alexandrium_andersonii.AAC.1
MGRSGRVGGRLRRHARHMCLRARIAATRRAADRPRATCAQGTPRQCDPLLKPFSNKGLAADPNAEDDDAALLIRGIRNSARCTMLPW